MSVAPVPWREPRSEQEKVRRSAEIEEWLHKTIEESRRSVAQKRATLEKQRAAAEERLALEKEAAMVLKAEAEIEMLSGSEAHGGLVGAWPEVESAAARAREADARLAQLRRLALEESEGDRQQLEAYGGLYEFLCAATGVRFDDREPGVQGCVAIGGRARAFGFGEAAVATAADKEATADDLWQTIEACLPEGAVIVPPVLPAPLAASGPAASGAAAQVKAPSDLDDDDAGFASPCEG